LLLDKAQEYNLPDDLRFSNWRILDENQIEGIIKWLWAGESCKQIERIIKALKSSIKQLEELAKN
jgi:malate/lactate dehydrogenase